MSTLKPGACVEGALSAAVSRLCGAPGTIRGCAHPQPLLHFSTCIPSQKQYRIDKRIKIFLKISNGARVIISTIQKHILLQAVINWFLFSWKENNKISRASRLTWLYSFIPGLHTDQKSDRKADLQCRDSEGFRVEELGLVKRP